MKTVFLVMMLYIFFSCNSSESNCNVQPFKTHSIENIGFNKSMKSLVYSFIAELRRYSDTINMVGHIKIIDSNEGNDFKVCLYGIESENELYQLNIDNYFTQSGFHFSIDYNQSNLLNPSKNFKKKDFIKYSRINDYVAADTRMPAWLVHIKNDSIKRINKYARSLSSPMPEKVGRLTKNGLKYYRINEWGEIIDDDEKVIGIYDGR